MKIRDWPPRRIGRMWLTGIGLQVAAVLIVPPLLGWEYAGFGADAAAENNPLAIDSTAARDSTHRAPVDVRPVTVTRTPLPEGDTLIRISRDSSFFAFHRMSRSSASLLLCVTPLRPAA